ARLSDADGESGLRPLKADDARTRADDPDKSALLGGRLLHGIDRSRYARWYAPGDDRDSPSLWQASPSSHYLPPSVWDSRCGKTVATRYRFKHASCRTRPSTPSAHGDVPSHSRNMVGIAVVSS